MFAKSLSCVWLYKWPPCSPNFRHRSVARSNERHATPSYKIRAGSGNRTPIPRVSTRGRNHMTTVVNPCWERYDFGNSYPHHQAALSQYCDSSVFLKYATFRTSMHNLETSVTIVITTTSRCRPTCRDSSVLTTYTDWFNEVCVESDVILWSVESDMILWCW